MILRHPVLTQPLRLAFPDELDIQEEVPLSEGPLGADLVMIRTRTDDILPHPCDLWGQPTLAEFKGPHDTATEKELETLKSADSSIVAAIGCQRALI